jgi:hypothetical protein
MKISDELLTPYIPKAARGLCTPEHFLKLFREEIKSSLRRGPFSMAGNNESEAKPKLTVKELAAQKKARDAQDAKDLIKTIKEAAKSTLNKVREELKKEHQRKIQMELVNELIAHEKEREEDLEACRSKNTCINDTPELKAKYAKGSKRTKRLEHIRKVLKDEPVPHGLVYLHISNSGVTFRVVDHGSGPQVEVHFGSFGAATMDFIAKVSPESLGNLGSLFTKASKGKFSPTYCYAAGGGGR